MRRGEGLVTASKTISSGGNLGRLLPFSVGLDYLLQVQYKNGHILPTGQWYAPSAVINDALIMQ